MQFRKAFLVLGYALFFMLLMTNKAMAVDTVRLAGDNRYDTALQVSQNGWQQSQYVVIATGQNYPDALCATPLAKKYNAPILLVDGTSLDAKVAQELERLKVQSVFIIGGYGIISEDIENSIRDLGIDVERISGSDRYETSAKVAAKLGTTSGVFVAYGHGFADVLSAAPIAAAKQMPILLTGKNELPESIRQYLSDKQVSQSYIIGGTGVIDASIASNLPNSKRISGKDRYDTNIAVVKEFSAGLQFETTYIATGEDYPDALAGSAAAAQTSSPIILVSNTLQSVTRDYVQSKLSLIKTINIIGGESAVTAKAIYYVTADKIYTGPVIMLDAGHGGYDAGAVGPTGVREKDVNLAVTLKVGQILKQHGIQVLYTRTSDQVAWPSNEKSDLQKRAEMANEAQVDYFICIHSNSVDDAPNVRGTETYYSAGNTQGAVLAQSIQNEIVKKLGRYDRGIKTANYYVLKNINATSILVEMAFISNPTEEKMLASDAYQQKWAEAIAQGILNSL